MSDIDLSNINSGRDTNISIDNSKIEKVIYKYSKYFAFILGFILLISMLLLLINWNNLVKNKDEENSNILQNYVNKNATLIADTLKNRFSSEVVLNNEESDNELISIWQNTFGVIKLQSKVRLLENNDSVLVLQSDYYFYKEITNWKTISKKKALEEIVIYIKSKHQNYETLKKGFVNGKFLRFEFIYNKYGVKLTYSINIKN